MTCFAGIYTSDGGRWENSNLSGRLAIQRNRILQTHVFTLTDTKTESRLFENELYIDLYKHYKRHSELFYSYPIQDGHIGFHFTDIGDAVMFKAKVVEV